MYELKAFLKKYSIGSHVSCEGGLHKIFNQAEYLGIDIVQCFTKNNRQWMLDDFTDKEVEDFLAVKNKQKSIKKFVSHASYLINLISSDKEIKEKALKALKAEINRCEQVEFNYIVVHPGSNQKKATNYIDELSEQFIEGISLCKKTSVLIENSSGQGTSVPYLLEDIIQLYKKIKKHTKHIGICLDTCHLFAAGYDIGEKGIWKEIIDLIDSEIGIEAVKVIHINNSKKPLGSRVDRHEHIKNGLIREEGFSFLLKDPYFKSIPKILETPWEPNNSIEDYIQNFEALHKMME
jgi:deoxyribonuclease-4